MTTIAVPHTAVRAVPARSAAVRPAAPAPRLRLTRRGRVVLGGLAVVPVLLVGLLLGVGAPGAVAEGEPSADTHSYVSVAPGQTLWQLAESLVPGADPREVIADIMDLNRLESASVAAGQRLAIPHRYAG